jgi:putative DNA primase/helicase
MMTYSDRLPTFLKHDHDWNQLLTAIDVELARVRWSVSQAKEYVMSTYHQRSRKLLSDRQLIEFWQYLRNLS